MRTIFISSALLFTLWSCSDGGPGTSALADSSGQGMQMDSASAAGSDMMVSRMAMIDSMHGVKSYNDPDKDFAALMRAHHLGAIELAKMEVARGTDPDLRGLAQKMIDDQQREVAQFDSVLAGKSAPGGSDAYYREAMAIMNGMAMEMDHSGTIDQQFARMMVPHHQSAIDMARAYLKQEPRNETLRRIARQIITSQEKEIGELNAWLQQKGSRVG